jgi:hypothetical protein
MIAHLPAPDSNPVIQIYESGEYIKNSFINPLNLWQCLYVDGYIILTGIICNMWSLLWYSGPLKKVYTCTDLMIWQVSRAEFQTDRHTDCTDNMDTASTGQINSNARCQQRTLQWTSHKHSDVCCIETWAGEGTAGEHGGGRGWETAASIGLKGKFCVLECAWWAFSVVIAAWGGGG